MNMALNILHNLPKIKVNARKKVIDLLGDLKEVSDRRRSSFVDEG